MNNIDIVDEHNQPTGKTSGINDAVLNGLWHRGVHVVVCSKTGYVLVQKRSSSMVMHPGFLDFSVGGFVDTNETPEHAAIREVKEETGLSFDESDLQFLAIQRKSHAWPKRHAHKRAFVYIYAIVIPDHRSVSLIPQKEEVDWVRFVSIRKLQTLLRQHNLKGLGRIEPTYSFYRELLRAIKPLL